MVNVRVGKVGCHLTTRFPTGSNVVVCHDPHDSLTLTLKNNDEPGSWYVFWVVHGALYLETLLGGIQDV